MWKAIKLILASPVSASAVRLTMSSAASWCSPAALLGVHADDEAIMSGQKEREEVFAFPVFNAQPEEVEDNPSESMASENAPLESSSSQMKLGATER